MRTYSEGGGGLGKSVTPPGGTCIRSIALSLEERWCSCRWGGDLAFLMKRILTRHFIRKFCQHRRAESAGGRGFDRFGGHTERVPGIQSRSCGRGAGQLFAAVEPTPGHYRKRKGNNWGGRYKQGRFQSWALLFFKLGRCYRRLRRRI